MYFFIVHALIYIGCGLLVFYLPSIAFLALVSMNEEYDYGLFFCCTYLLIIEAYVLTTYFFCLNAFKGTCCKCGTCTLKVTQNKHTDTYEIAIYFLLFFVNCWLNAVTVR